MKKGPLIPSSVQAAVSFLAVVGNYYWSFYYTKVNYYLWYLLTEHYMRNTEANVL